MSVEAKTKAYIATLELDELGEARAELALMLSAKLDQASGPKAPVGVAQSIPGMAQRLVEVLDRLSQADGEADEFVANLFSLPTGLSA